MAVPVDDVAALVAAARAAVGERRIHDALQLCDRAALRSDEGRYLAARLRGDILLDLGDARGALSSYDSVAEPTVPDPELDLSRGLALFELARLAEADNALRSALRGKPDAAEGHYTLGLIAEMEGSGEQDGYFRRARLLAPGRYPASAKVRPEQFTLAVTAAVAKLDGPTRARLSQTPLLVAEYPNAADLARRSPPISPLAFVMRVAVRTVQVPGQPPDSSGTALLLFKRNIERAYPEAEAMVRAIGETLSAALEDEGDLGAPGGPVST